MKVARRRFSLRPGLIVNDTECPFLGSKRSVCSSKCPRTCGSIATQGNKTVLVLDGQAEANGTARLFVLGEGPFRVRRRGETRRVEAETWHRPRRSLRPDAKATVQIAQRAIAPPTVSWSAPIGAKLAFTPAIKRGGLGNDITMDAQPSVRQVGVQAT